MDTSKSLITRRDSTLVKGLLILLIIVGHNGILMGKAPGLSVTAFNDYLYSFHVYLFLILPFLYNIPRITKERVKKDFIHLYKPYTLMFITLVFINIFVMRQSFDFNNTFIAYVSGNEIKLKEAIGASFPWFIPTMFSLLLLRNYFLNKSKKILLLSVIVSFTIFITIRFFRLISIYTFEYEIIGITVATTYFSLAVVCRYIYEKYHDKKMFNIISVSAFVISTMIFFVFHPTYNIVFNIVRYAVLPISALFTFIYFVNRLRIAFIENVLNYFGQESLPIYMIHVFIYNILLIIIQKFHIALDIYSGIISLILTIVITILIIYLCKRIKIYKYLFR